MSTENGGLGPLITHITMRGVKYPVFCNSHGWFTTIVEGHELTSPTLGELRVVADRVPRRKVGIRLARITTPYSGRLTEGVQPGSVTFGTATGFHAVNTDSLLIDWDGQRKGSQSGSRIENAVQIRNPSEQAEIENLLTAELKAMAATRAWIEAHAFDPYEAAREALGATTGGGGE